MLIQSLSSIGAGIIIAFIYSWEFALFILGLAPFFIIAGFLEMQLMVGLSGSEALEGAGQVSIIQCLYVLMKLLKHVFAVSILYPSVVFVNFSPMKDIILIVF